ncbi:unnamed protein product [Zymoseptoria tritici ST99CH_1A5]|uniref:Ketoreductase domain-containing protein n=3 Tax=Zymoseptoria tritici TaxID=1047171 RepID=A0A1X7RT01_ZYMT9|nr:unnamed protein product [Zymoseptoria tritici ST99CH_3D7]SMR52231.1 unnamed protein product [Zymoseptoria tritici ST99CH_1E4]SMR53356.1 unnamed protein product [Zymoseptoria tritici ST99CH_3D1]SMY24184.1 unnamed protein product [Zymoseptoria tritici ST99CH_1A5]
MAHQGKTVLVTGGASGLGRATAEHFLSVGSNVVICDISKTALADFDEKVASINPDRALAVETDVTSESALDSLFEQIEKKFGHLDYAINSAGVMDHFDPVGEVSRAEFDRVIAVNLTAPTFITKRAVTSMLKAGVKGSIVNIASLAAFKGWAGGSAYTISKHGLIGLTKSTAAFYRTKGIRCNAVAAGAMATNIAAHFGVTPPNAEGLDLNMKAFGKWEGAWTDPAKLAKLIATLCDEDNEMVNGAVVNSEFGITA